MNSAKSKCKLWGTARCVQRDNEIIQEALKLIPPGNPRNPDYKNQKVYSISDATKLVCKECAGYIN